MVFMYCETRVWFLTHAPNMGCRQYGLARIRELTGSLHRAVAVQILNFPAPPAYEDVSALRQCLPPRETPMWRGVDRVAPLHLPCIPSNHHLETIRPAQPATYKPGPP